MKAEANKSWINDLANIMVNRLYIQICSIQSILRVD